MANQLHSFCQDINVAVIGASGAIGSALIGQLAQSDKVKTIYAFSRSQYVDEHEKVRNHSIDITDEDSIKEASSICGVPLDMVIVASGMLKEEPHLPEKSLRDLDFEAMRKCFSVNAFGPALIAKYFLPLISKHERSVFACLSARVGSISDNGIGGWYSYRASKAALNMMIKSTAIETARRYKEAVIIGLHPGTVDSNLSKPFQGNVKHEIFTPEKAADNLLKVIDTVQPHESGKCFAWDGQEVKP